MFTNTTEPTDLDRVIERVRNHLQSENPASKEYDALSTQFVKLTKLRAETEAPSKLSKDTLALIAANLLGIVIIVGYEHAHVITSKALGFVSKLR